ncbi:serine/threonine-protein kinase [Sandaracinus amylolyticus]|uniref:serine/threonine-protein kinase n=1 Tax=Sandaracinus amylolyticus TaxID=927083 RepID=UPI001F3CA688|nr:serine/threonine-protein kinase [Sandaracinus amylolyticus]UJR79344.1 Serine/threonine protein kinase PrkC, regulator of stationary phase [Sandaracinus amylolyticus]
MTATGASNDATVLAKPNALGSASTSPGELRCATCGATHPTSYRVCPSDGTPLGSLPPGVEDPMLGAVLAGTFRVRSRLGEGGMGLVYEAEHLRLERRYAVKVIHHGFAWREDLLARFDREARAMSQVRSDHVVDVVDVLRTPDGRPCIVAEKLEGEDLEQHLARETKLSAPRAIRLFRQVCRGLAAAHARGVVHRDLKPSNLFLARDPAGGVTLKILDFGVAKIGGDAELTGTGAIVGTPAYMSPEQARGSANVDARSDVYSAGALLYRMLTGRAPYGSADASVTLVKLLEESPERARTIEPAIPEGVEAVIERAMARDPEARFASIDEMEHAIAVFDAGGTSTVITDDVRPISAARTKSINRRAKWARPLAIGGAVSASLGVGLGVGTFLALLVDGLREGAQIHDAELVLVVLGALVALAAALAGSTRALRGAWRSAPAIEAVGARAWTALGAGVFTYGAMEIASRVWSVVALLRPGHWDPLWSAARVVIALGVGVVVAMMARKRA